MNKYIFIYNDKNQVQSAMLMNGIAFVIAKMLPETNYYTCSRSGQMNKNCDNTFLQDIMMLNK